MYPIPLQNTPINLLLDAVCRTLRLQNDAQLSRVLGVVPPVVSKLRHHRIPVGPSLLIRLHEITGWPIRDIKRQLGIPALNVLRRQ